MHVCVPLSLSCRARVEDSHGWCRDGLGLEAGWPSAEGAMWAAGLMALACVCHPDKTGQNVPGEGELEEGSIAVFCRFSSLLILGFLLSNESEVSAILWQRPGTAWAPILTPSLPLLPKREAAPLGWSVSGSVRAGVERRRGARAVAFTGAGLPASGREASEKALLVHKGRSSVKERSR